jgi:hypothetical protein
MELKGFKLKFKAEGKVLEKGERDEAKRDADAKQPAAGCEPSSNEGEQ